MKEGDMVSDKHYGRGIVRAVDSKGVSVHFPAFAHLTLSGCIRLEEASQLKALKVVK
jgi:hypothetical protein